LQIDDLAVLQNQTANEWAAKPAPKSSRVRNFKAESDQAGRGGKRGARGLVVALRPAGW
jgi:hypothetical protein